MAALESTAALVLAAGSSRRLGQPKQLLPFGETTLLGATLAKVRESKTPQVFVTLGANADAVKENVDLTGVEVVESVEHDEGCSSSIRYGLGALGGDIEGVVLLLGDQPGIALEAIHGVIKGANDAPIAVCRYSDGIGHPFYFSRSTFERLGNLHGDKAVWKVIESGEFEVVEVPMAGTIPLDVDTWEDYRAICEREGLAIS
jgi:molybdenum cofactor cytidylyltransferase